MEKSKETNELINLINLNGIKLLLDKECIASLRGLLIGLENFERNKNKRVGQTSVPTLL